MGHSSWNQNPMYPQCTCWVAFKERYFFCETAVHTEPKGLTWELLWKQAKVEGHCQQVQRLLKPAIPTQGIVNIGSWPLHPTAQNFVLQAHMLEVLLFRGLRSWRAASAVSPEPVRNQRTQKCLPVKWCSACGCAATGSLTFQVQKCVQHSADSTELSTCCLLVTSNKACIFLSSAQSRTLPLKVAPRKCLLPWALVTTKEWDCVGII